MNTGKKYCTKQKLNILQCIIEHADTYVTTKQLEEYLKDGNTKVGLTTIYRNLDKLIEENRIMKVPIAGVNGNCYRYLSYKEKEAMSYLKCENCGDVIPVDCTELIKLYDHISEEHHILINPIKTMFYGKCNKCIIKD